MTQNPERIETFTYSQFFKFVYRFGNILVSLLLIFYQITIILFIDKDKLLILLLAMSLFLLYILNKHFFLLYRILPLNIEADNEKLICRDFIFSGKQVIIYFADIQSLSGGVFENKMSGLMKVCDGKNLVCIGFYRKLKNSDKIISIILSKVNRAIYDDVLSKITEGRKKRRQ